MRNEMVKLKKVWAGLLEAHDACYLSERYDGMLTCPQIIAPISTLNSEHNVCTWSQ